MVREQIPFLMEVVLGTAADRKGGHIAQRLQRRAADPARDGADAAGGRGVVPRLPALALLQHQLTVDRPDALARALRGAAAGSSCR